MSTAHSSWSPPVACAAQPPNHTPAKLPVWCTSMTMPIRVPRRPMPCWRATSCVVGGNVAMWLAPITTANAIIAAADTGNASSAAMPRARTRYRPTSSAAASCRFIAKPIARLPAMLAAPATAIHRPAIEGGSPQRSITPGMCAARKAM